MTPFRERNPVKVGAASLAVIVLLLVVAFKAGDLPLIGGGTSYRADFADASGLKVNDEVRIAGVRVGKVTAINLRGNHITVDFKINKPAKFGTNSGADIRVRTLLGAMYLAVNPDGPGQLKDDAIIPSSRTTSAYTVVDAFSGLAQRAEDINLDQLKQAFNTLSDAAANTPAPFQAALQGVSALSANIAARDAQLQELLGNLNTVSGILGNRDADIVDLMKKSSILMNALTQRRASIHTLLTSTQDLAAQLTALTTQSKADITPALQQLKGVTDVLIKDQSSLDEALRLAAPFYRVFANLLGNGPWFDTWIPNFPVTP